MIDGYKHAVESVGIVIGFFLEEHSDGKSREFRRENGPHAMRHVHLAAGELFEASETEATSTWRKTFEQGSGIIGGRGFLPVFAGGGEAIAAMPAAIRMKKESAPRMRRKGIGRDVVFMAISQDCVVRAL